MRPKISCLLVTSLLSSLALGACTEMPDSSGQGYLNPLPESIIALAGPNQDLTAVRLVPEDGCLWYRYAGPVETTMLPLRTADGRPICTKVAEG
jgi:hypothetical protein